MAQRLPVVNKKADIRAVLRTYLEHDRFVAGEASTGDEALRRSMATDGTAPHVVQLDICHPDLDDLMVLRTSRRSFDTYVRPPATHGRTGGPGQVRLPQHPPGRRHRSPANTSIRQHNRLALFGGRDVPANW